MSPFLICADFLIWEGGWSGQACPSYGITVRTCEGHVSVSRAWLAGNCQSDMQSDCPNGSHEPSGDTPGGSMLKGQWGHLLWVELPCSIPGTSMDEARCPLLPSAPGCLCGPLHLGKLYGITQTSLFKPSSSKWGCWGGGRATLEASWCARGRSGTQTPLCLQCIDLC